MRRRNDSDHPPHANGPERVHLGGVPSPHSYRSRQTGLPRSSQIRWPMARPRILRLLRIAASAVCLIVCGLLIALWVRSYQWRHEFFGIPFWKGTLAIVSMNGELEFHTFPATTNDIFGDRTDRLDSELLGYSSIPSTIGPSGVSSSPSTAIPHWIALIIVSIAGTGLWLPWSRRFSLRTLLIATTLAAVMLGLAVAFR
jgi:hypothetical protein